jgi:electron transport complex protein RnfD
MKLIVSSPPHWHDGGSIAKIHFQMILALLPALALGVYTYGLDAARVVSLAVATAILSELLIRTLFRKPTGVTDGSAILIGLIFAMLLPPSIPFWVVIIGVFFSIFIGREVFGGLGSNPLNPVLVGWAIVRISWPAYFDMNMMAVNYDLGFNFRYPLTILKKGGVDFISGFKPLDLLLGKQVSGLGSAAILLILVGGIYILIKKVITWEIPASFAAGILVTSTFFWLVNPAAYANPLFHILTWNVMMGIFFLSTDFSSSPFNRWGMIIFGFGCGFLTIILRAWSNYPDGVFFAILIMNLFTPLLDGVKKRPASPDIVFIDGRQA